jgi:hypothetical protein
MSRRPSRRKTIIIDKKVQAKIFFQTSVPMFACLVLAVVGEVVYQRLLDSGHIQTDGTLFFGMPESRLGMLLLFVSACTVQVVVSLLASQKVAGVAYHIQRILGEFRAGDRKARVRLRRGDYQLRLADDVNAFLQWVEDGASTTGGPLPNKTHSDVIPYAPDSAPGGIRRPRSAPVTKETQD